MVLSNKIIPFLLLLSAGFACGCGGASNARITPAGPSEAEYIIGYGEADFERGQEALGRDAARRQGDANIARALSGSLTATFRSRTSDIGGRVDTEIEQELTTVSTLDESLRSLVTDVPNSLRCKEKRCVLKRMLKRSEARARYDRSLATQLSDFKAHGESALGRGDDIFSFAGDFASAQSAYRSSVAIVYRRRAVDPRASLALPAEERALWARLSKERARRLAALRLTILPVGSVDFRTTVKLANLPEGTGRRVKDPSLEDGIRDNLAAATRSLRLKTEVADGCTRGVKIAPAAKLSCQIRSGFHLCSLDIGGTVAPCGGGGRVAEFWLGQRGIRAADQGNDYDTLRRKLLTKLGQSQTTERLVEKLSAHLPIER
jgi:hypothetical protein